MKHWSTYNPFASAEMNCRSFLDFPGVDLIIWISVSSELQASSTKARPSHVGISKCWSDLNARKPTSHVVLATPTPILMVTTSHVDHAYCSRFGFFQSLMKQPIETPSTVRSHSGSRAKYLSDNKGRK